MDDHDELVQRLQSLGRQPIESARQSADLTAMAGVRPLGRRRLKLRTAAVVVAGLLVGSTGLAAADVLPDPAQHVAHTALKRVGVDVPNPARYYKAGTCGGVEKKNHGAYVRDDHSLAGSDCGKPLHATVGGGQSTDAPKADKGSCHGKPAWAGNKLLTKDQRSAAVAARVAKCGDQTDATETDTTDTTEGNSKVPEAGSTSTTTEPDTSAPDTTGDGTDGANDHAALGAGHGRSDKAPAAATS